MNTHFAEPRRWWPTERTAVACEWLVVAATAWFVGRYAAVALGRLFYPFDLEWMEGAMVNHVGRILQGQPLYGAPTLHFTAFLYPPLYYYVSAGVASVTGLGFLPLRMVSIASSFAVFWILYRIVRQATESRYAGILAVGLFAATYDASGGWFDLARNDSLFLALMLYALFALRFRASAWGWAGAGCLLGLAALTKQTAVLMLPALLLYAVLVDWRKAIVLVAALVAVLGTATAALNAATHGWYLHYTLWLPFRIEERVPEAAAFWTEDILRTVAVPAALAVALCAIALRDPTRRDPFWPLIAIGGLSAAWLSRLHSGAYLNVLMPAYASLAILAGAAARLLPSATPRPYRPVVRAAIALLCIGHLAGSAYSAQAQVPGAGDAELAREFGRTLASYHGAVLVPYHSFVPTPAGPVMHAHAWAIFDELRSGDPTMSAQLAGEIEYELSQQEYEVVVLDKMEPWLERPLDKYYRRVAPALGADGLWTRTGYHTRPRWIYRARHLGDDGEPGGSQR